MARKISTTEWKFELGDRVKDRVSGFEGTVCTRSEHLNGCKQYGVNPPIDKNTGKMLEGYNIDGEQLELIDEGLNKKDPIVKKQTGSNPTPIQPNIL
jgi:hypothetical protein